MFFTRSSILRSHALPLLLALVLVPARQGMADTGAALIDVVQIGVGLSKPPYIMGSGAGGLEYEIAEKALEAGGYRMVARHLPPARALALLRARHLDGMLSVTEGIGGDEYISEPYLHYQNFAISLTSRQVRLRGMDDLSLYSVAAFQNASMILGDAYKRAVTGHPAYKEYPQQLTQNKLLFTGRADVVVTDRLVFRYLSRQLESPIDSTQALTFHPLFPPSPRMAAFRDIAIRNGFNTGLRTIRQNGTYGAILKKYQEFLQP